MRPPKLLLLLSYSDILTVATVSWLVSLNPRSANFRVQNCAARLVLHAPPHVHITAVLRHLHWLPVRARISYKTACLCFNAITSSTPSYLSDLLICTPLLDFVVPVPTPASSKCHSISARQKVIVLSLTLVLQSGTHCHCTLEMLQLSTPSSQL